MSATPRTCQHEEREDEDEGRDPPTRIRPASGAGGTSSRRPPSLKHLLASQREDPVAIGRLATARKTVHDGAPRARRFDGAEDGGGRFEHHEERQAATTRGPSTREQFTAQLERLMPFLAISSGRSAPLVDESGVAHPDRDPPCQARNEWRKWAATTVTIQRCASPARPLTSVESQAAQAPSSASSKLARCAPAAAALRAVVRADAETVADGCRAAVSKSYPSHACNSRPSRLVTAAAVAIPGPKQGTVAVTPPAHTPSQQPQPQWWLTAAMASATSLPNSWRSWSGIQPARVRVLGGGGHINCLPPDAWYVVMLYLDLRTLSCTLSLVAPWLRHLAMSDPVWRDIARRNGLHRHAPRTDRREGPSDMPPPAAVGVQPSGEVGRIAQSVIGELRERHDVVERQVLSAQRTLAATEDRIRHRIDTLAPFHSSLSTDILSEGPQLQQLLVDTDRLSHELRSRMTQLDEQRIALNLALSEARLLASKRETELRSIAQSFAAAREGQRAAVGIAQFEKRVVQLVVNPADGSSAPFSLILRRGVDSFVALDSLCQLLPHDSPVSKRWQRVTAAIPLDDDYFAVRDELLFLSGATTTTSSGTEETVAASSSLGPPPARGKVGAPAAATRRDVVRRLLRGFIDNVPTDASLKSFFGL